MILYIYGGAYSDLDCECHQPIDDWIKDRKIMVTRMGGYTFMLNNFLLCSEKGNIFWKNLMKRCTKTECPKIVPDRLRIPYTTGPMALTTEYKFSNYDIAIVNSSKYIEHRSEMSWKSMKL